MNILIAIFFLFFANPAFADVLYEKSSPPKKIEWGYKNYSAKKDQRLINSKLNEGWIITEVHSRSGKIHQYQTGDGKVFNFGRGFTIIFPKDNSAPYTLSYSTFKNDFEGRDGEEKICRGGSSVFKVNYGQLPSGQFIVLTKGKNKRIVLFKPTSGPLRVKRATLTCRSETKTVL